MVVVGYEIMAERLRSRSIWMEVSWLRQCTGVVI